MRLAGNLVAGLASSTWVALVGLAATPFYLALLGAEAYGMVGFFMTLQALMSLLDLGLSPTMNREVARGLASASPGPARRLLHSLESIYWTVAVAIAALVALSAGWLGNRWLQADRLAPADLQQALVLMGLAIGARWPAGLFLAAANGAQRLVHTSAATAAYMSVSALGAIALLAFYEASLPVYFAWQAFAALAYTLCLRSLAWSALGGRDGARFSGAEILRVSRFSGAMGLIAFSGVLLTQLDKVLLSRLLGLEEFGRYMVAAMVAGSLYLLVTPIFNAVYPRFSAMLAAGGDGRLASLYRDGTRGLATLVFPVAMVLVVFPAQIVQAWTGDPAVATAVAPVVALLVAGTALHAMMFFPYALQLAAGMPRLALITNLVLVALLVPLTLLLTLSHASRGAALAWFILHAFYLAFGTWLTHRHLLRGLGRGWLLRDIGLPLALTAAVALAGIAAGARHAGPWLAWAVAMWFAAVASCVLVSPRLLATAREFASQLAARRE